VNIGEEVVVDIQAIAHGGHCVARYEGRVIFVRHSIPGEKVRIRITGLTKNFARADVIEVLESSPDRVAPKCKFAHSDGCGGCDFQHIKPARQRSLKAEIIAEQFRRLAKIDLSIEVEEVSPVFAWRTRMEFTATADRKPGLFKSRSNELIEIDRCEIADSKIDFEKMSQLRAPTDRKIHAIVDSSETASYFVENREDFKLVKQTVAGFDFEISPESFWQSHVRAPELLTEVVTAFAEFRSADHVFDLYSGVGLFAVPAISAVGAAGRVTLIEESISATTDARRIFANYPNVEILQGRVEKLLSKFMRADVVIADPPRTGAGEKVLGEIVRLAPRTLIYVACDPAALARDTSTLIKASYKLDEIRAFDLFPMTAHMEVVARFIK